VVVTAAAVDSSASTGRVGSTETNSRNNNRSLSSPSPSPWQKALGVLSPGRRRRQNYQYSVDRLRVVYADLLQHIDYESTVSAGGPRASAPPTPTPLLGSSRKDLSTVATRNSIVERCDDEKKDDEDRDGYNSNEQITVANNDNVGTSAADTGNGHDDGGEVLLDRAHQHRDRKSVNEEDLEHLKRSLRFSFRRSLIPTTSATTTGPSTLTPTKTRTSVVACGTASGASTQDTDNEPVQDKTNTGGEVVDDGTAYRKPQQVVGSPRPPKPTSIGGETSNNSNLDLDAAFCMLAATRSPSDRPYGLGFGGGSGGGGRSSFSSRASSGGGQIPKPSTSAGDVTVGGNTNVSSSSRQPSTGAPPIATATTMSSGIGRRDDGDQIYKNSMQRAHAIERRVVDLIETIGIIVVNGEMSDIDNRNNIRNNDGSGSQGGSFQNGRNGVVFTVGKRSCLRGGRTDPVFEYFTEKCILSLLVDIAKEARDPGESADDRSSSTGRAASQLSVRGVIWSPAVKAQVYRTVSMLVSDVRNQSVLFYLLSQNFINELIESFLPVQQWTDPALALMLPAYVDLLKMLTLQLTDDPQLFPFLTSVQEGSDDLSFPLFSAALEVATSYHGQSDSQLYATMLAVVVNIMQIPSKPIQAWMNESAASQRKLSTHLCQRLVEIYQRMTNTTIGPVVDGSRHNIIAGQLVSMKDHLRLIHEVFWSGVRGLDVRLCESLLREAVAPILTNLSPTFNSSSQQRRFMIVGLIDADIIPESEARAQVSTVVLSLMFSTLAYIPFQRMLAVALLHPDSSPIWSSVHAVNQSKSTDDYVLMPILSDIVNKENDREFCPNIFREELVRTLQGDCGEWRTTTTACILQSVLSVGASESDIANTLQISSGSGDHHSNIEEAVSSFLTREHSPSAISAQALVVEGFLALQLIYCDLMRSVQDTNDVKRTMASCLAASPVWNAMLDAHKLFCESAVECSKESGIADVFLDLIEAAIQGRYTPRYGENGRRSYICSLSRIGSSEHTLDAEVLVRQMRGVTPSDVETARFYIYMSLHFRSLCKVIDRLCFDIERQHRAPTPPTSPSKKTSEVSHSVSLDLVDKVDDLCKALGGLEEEDDVAVGVDLNLSGRMTFRFKSNLKKIGKSTVKGLPSRKASSSSSSSNKTNATAHDVGVLRSTGHLMIVLDQKEILVVKPQHGKAAENRGVVLCCIALRSIIAAASDGSWLHVATKHDDISGLVKNGNMALEFDSPSTSLIVKQYLDRSREVLKQDMIDKSRALLRPHKSI